MKRYSYENLIRSIVLLSSGKVNIRVEKTRIYKARIKIFSGFFIYQRTDGVNSPSAL